ncbi:MAG: hypothetical protein QHI38_00150 [Armatimonadota bacterium]|nr:hypothetical protein [Armatimonadota bacterium]
MRFPRKFVGFLVLTLVMFAANSAGAVYVKEFAAKNDFTVGSHERTGFDERLGGLAILDTIDCVPILWVPSPTANAVLKLDGRTGRQLAVYRLGPRGAEWRPCAVTSDPFGNAYVACACPGRSGKVVRIRAVPSGDTNGDSIVTTSSDRDQNGLIGLNEVLDWGQDDCVDVLADTGPETQPSALTFDSDGALWVALEGTSAVARVDLVSGVLTAVIELPGKPSSIWADAGGSIWVLSRRDHALYRVSTRDRTVAAVHDLGDSSPVAMCFDTYGRIWVADEYGTLIVVHPEHGMLFRYATDYCGGFAGIAVDDDGNIWASCPVKGLVTCFSAVDGAVMDEIPVGGSPQQLCFDSDGTLWVLNGENKTVSGIDVGDRRVVRTAPSLPASCSSTPFSSAVYVRGIPSNGTWTVLIDAGTPDAAWGTVVWKAEENGGQVQVEARAANTPAELPLCAYVSVRSGEALSVGEGRYLALRISLTRGPKWSPVVRWVRVEGKNRPPDTSGAVALIDTSKPGTAGYLPIIIGGIVDPDGDSFTVRITSVTFDESASHCATPGDDAQLLGIGSPTLWIPDKLLKGQGGCSISFQAIDSEGGVSEGVVQLAPK